MGYPTSVQTFSTKVDNVNLVDAADINVPQTEITALETGLLNGIAHVLKPDADATRTLGALGLRWLAAYVKSLVVSDPSQGTNLKNWAMTTSGVTLIIEALDDSGNALLTTLTVDRSGNTTINGNTVSNGALTTVAGTLVSQRASSPVLLLEETSGASGQKNLAVLGGNGAGQLGFYKYDDAITTPTRLGYFDTNGNFFTTLGATVPGRFNISGGGQFTAASLASGNNNDLNPIGFASTSVVNITPDAGGGSIITGLHAGVQGDVVLLQNVGPAQFVITMEDTNSAAANRFAASTQAAVILKGRGCICTYDGNRWHAMANTS